MRREKSAQLLKKRLKWLVFFPELSKEVRF